MMKLLNLTGLTICSLLFPITVLSSTCSDTAKSIIENPVTADNLSKLGNIVGQWEKTAVKEQTYIWKSEKGSSTYTMVVRDGITIRVEDKGMHPDFGNRKYPTFSQATKQLGKAELGSVKQLTKTYWNCRDTHSSIAVFSNESGKIISYSGQYCPSQIFSDDCVTFGDWALS